MTPEVHTLPKDWAVPEMLVWARQQMGLSASAAAERAEVTPEVLRRWETGADKPQLHELETLAAVYDCPVGYFFLGHLPAEVPPPLDFRGVSEEKRETLSYDTRRQLRRFTRLMRLAKDLIEASGAQWTVNVGEASSHEPAEQVAAREASRLGAVNRTAGEETTGAVFERWRGAIEAAGVLVIALRLNPKEMRGASLWLHPGPPGILVNREDAEAGAGRTFTLLHEYGHLLRRQPGLVCDFRATETDGHVERFANQFAAAAIVPKDALSEVLEAKGLHGYRSSWSDELLRQLKKPFGASKDTIAIELEEMGLAPEGFYRRRRAVWERQRPGGAGGRGGGGGVTTVKRRIRELGRNLSRVLALAHSQRLLTTFELAEIADLKAERADDFIELAKAPQAST